MYSNKGQDEPSRTGDKKNLNAFNREYLQGFSPEGTDDLHLFCCVKKSLHKGLYLQTVPLLCFNIIFLVGVCSVKIFRLKEIGVPVLLTLCSNTLQSVSDFSTANPVVKGHWITVLENLIGIGEFLFIITQTA